MFSENESLMSNLRTLEGTHQYFFIFNDIKLSTKRKTDSEFSYIFLLQNWAVITLNGGLFPGNLTDQFFSSGKKLPVQTLLFMFKICVQPD